VQYKKLAACGLRDYFDTIVLSEDAGANKPSKAFFDYAFAKTGAAPETTLMIGDNMATDIQGAMAVGIDALLFNRWQYDIKSGDLEAPTYLVSKLLDIKQIL
jgi:putative hydrolase of the HAD superfamily